MTASPRAIKAVTVKTTRTEELRLRLADDIMHGVYAPGTQLDEIGLASRYGVSRTPVREALRQLSASGLVEIRPHRGAIVTRLSEERLVEMFVAMAELESVCAGLAAEAMTGPERASLEEIHQALGALVHTGDPSRYAEANDAFHSAIYTGSHNAYLADFATSTRARLAPFRRVQFRQIGRLVLSYAEHERIVAAIRQHDRRGASEAMHDHLGGVKNAFDRYAAGLLV